MFGFLRNTLRKMAGTSSDAQPMPVLDEVESAMTPATPAPTSNGHSRSTNAQQSNGKGIELSLQLVLKGLPLELQPRVKQIDVGDATMCIPLEMILSQLPRGVVKIAYGDLRQAAPDLFEGGADRDRMQVHLPLAEILAQLNPALIARKRVQKKINVPSEISSPFDTRGQGFVFSVGPAKGESGPDSGEQTATPEPVRLAPARQTISATPALRPPEATPPSMPAALQPAAPAAPRIQMPTSPPAAKPATEAAPLMVGLTALAEGWPEAVRQEIVQLNLVDAKVGMPCEAVERALKQGRIAFTWKMLRSWITPAPQLTLSAHDGAVLELPLKAVAPLFLARQDEAAKSKPKVAIDEKIPNLFFGFPQPEPSPAAKAAAANAGVGKLVDTNYYVWDDSSDTVRVHESEVKRSTSPGTSHVTRYSTPNDVVSRAAELEGVAGALIALPDGLMVASKLSPDLNGDTLAAFVPQLFGKLSQSTKELRMGELNNLNFTVGNVPWKIFRVNAIFFAAFGRAGEPLPTAQLAALAGELDHKSK